MDVCVNEQCFYVYFGLLLNQNVYVRIEDILLINTI